jgi:TRAP-type C4-dicarboxylate transport system permease small subunit
MTAIPRPLIWIGGGALLCAMATDAIAVVGRYIGMPLHGSIELVQAAVLVSGTMAMIIATLLHAHATVHVLVERLSPRLRALLGQFNCIMSALYTLLILAGTIWIAADQWYGHEMSELLGVPYRPLRLVLALGLAAIALLFLRPAKPRPAE